MALGRARVRGALAGLGQGVLNLSGKVRLGLVKLQFQVQSFYRNHSS